MRTTSDLLRTLTVLGAVGSGVAAAVSVVNAITIPRLARRPTEVFESVAVCIPARNEAERLPDLLRDLQAQHDCPNLRVFVLDDASTDDTHAAARRTVGDDTRFRVVASSEDPRSGWTGKAAACRVLADLALSYSPDLLVFLDADVRLEPGALAAAVATQRATGAALVSPWPSQECGTAVEELVQPLLSFSWMSTLPIALADKSVRPSTAVACGQFLMFDTEAYRSIGGHSSVADSLTEDLDIARALRRRGERTVLVSGGEFVRCRMYDGWPALRDGYGRWLWTVFGGPLGTVVGLGAVSVCYLIPPAAALFGSGSTRRWGRFGYAAAVGARVVSRRTETGRRVSLAQTLVVSSAHPASAAIYLWLTAGSVRRRRRGLAEWKGRPLATGSTRTSS